jgi:mono/diheme cytochrome c family protein
LLDATGSDLVSYLNHPNGWWRDNAQKELIVRGDLSVIPLLKKKANSSSGVVERLHALWTLEGLKALDKEVLLDALDDKEVQVIKSGIRLSEPWIDQSDNEVLMMLHKLSSHNSRDVRSQLLLSLSGSKARQAKSIVQKIVEESPDDPLLTAIQSSLQKTKEARKYGYRLSSLAPQVRQSIVEGALIFRSSCAPCHGPEGQGLPTDVAPPLISKFKLIEYKEEVIKIMLHGLKGPVDGRLYPEQMVPMGTNSDEWIASVLSYVRYDLCMRSFPQMGEGYVNWVTVTPAQVKGIRELYLDRKVPWTWEELFEERNRRQ